MTNQSLLPVTPRDREAYLSLSMLPPEDAEAVRAGKWDSLTGVQAFARHRLDHTAPAEPVLRWEGDKLWLGEHYAGQIGTIESGHWYAEVRLGWETAYFDDREEATAWLEQSVRDWLARAGLVRQGGEVVEDHSLCHRPGCSLHDIPLGLASCACHFAHPPASPTAEVVEAIKHAIFVFDTYAENHTAKGTAEGHLKAERNRQEATRLRTALRVKEQTNG